MPKEETCSNCQRVIGAEEAAFVHQNRIVCHECYVSLSTSEPVPTGGEIVSRSETYDYREALPTICFITGVLIWLFGLVIFMWSIANVNFAFLLPENAGLRIILCLLHAAIWFAAGLAFKIAGSMLMFLKDISTKVGQIN